MSDQYLGSILQTQPNYNVKLQNSSVKKTEETMGMDSFLTLLAAQLQYQDPMNPTQQDDYINQLTQLTVIESMKALTSASNTSYAASLIGKQVTVAAEGEGGQLEEIKGSISSVSLYGKEPMVVIDGRQFKLNQIMEVSPSVDPKRLEELEDKINSLQKELEDANSIKNNENNVNNNDSQSKIEEEQAVEEPKG